MIIIFSIPCPEVASHWTILSRLGYFWPLPTEYTIQFFGLGTDRFFSFGSDLDVVNSCATQRCHVASPIQHFFVSFGNLLQPPGQDLFYFLGQGRSCSDPALDRTLSDSTPGLLSSLHQLSYTHLRLIASMIVQMCAATTFWSSIATSRRIIPSSTSGGRPIGMVSASAKSLLSFLTLDCQCGSASYKTYV